MEGADPTASLASSPLLMPSEFSNASGEIEGTGEDVGWEVSGQSADAPSTGARTVSYNRLTNDAPSYREKYYTRHITSCDRRGSIERVAHRIQSKFSKHWRSLRTPATEEGLDFEMPDNLVSLDASGTTSATSLETGGILRWILAAFTAILIATCALILDLGINRLTDLKYNAVSQAIDAHRNISKRPMGVFVGIGILFVLIAGVFVAFLDVSAKGSGVPEIKSFLNGRKLHRVISLRTAASKVIGVVFAVAGSLVIGKEGPLIHTGAVIGAIVIQGSPENLRCASAKSHAYMRNDRYKRLFVSIGCACGVTAAFSAPIGGVLFAIEEAATYWSVSLTWITFYSTMLCAFVVNLILPITSHNDSSMAWGTLSKDSLISFGSFEEGLK